MEYRNLVNCKSIVALFILISIGWWLSDRVTDLNDIKKFTTILADMATIVGAGAVFFVMLQAVLVKKQLKADHERSRRENSVNLLLEWTKTLDELAPLARKIIESLSEEQTRNLYNIRGVKISKVMEGSLIRIFPEKKAIVVEGEYISLNDGQSSKLRSLGMNYLNTLEAILVAWQYSIIDREIIEHQFSFLFAPEQGHYALEKLRTAAGGEKSYPAIAIFANHLNVERSKKLIKKSNVDLD